MTPTQWERVKEITAEALGRPAPDRLGLVYSVCSDDPAVLREVLRLVAAAEHSADFLSSAPFPVRQLLENQAKERASFEPGQTVAGRFRIDAFLSRGGMGEVFAAFDLELRERVALKTIRPAIASSARVIERFKEEVRQTRSIAHPGVCRVYDLFCHEQPDREPLWFLTMELLEGETLAERLARAGPIPFQSALPLIKDIVSGLAAAHDLGIVHRDFKPRNVMLVAGAGPGRERTVVMDFGLALNAGGEAGAEGTPAYMAPEQAAGGAVTPAVDQFALGLVIAEMLTGKRPPVEPKAAPASPTYHDWLRRHAGANLPPAARNVVGRCLEIQPERRFAHVRDVLAAFDRRARRLRRLLPVAICAFAVLALLAVLAAFDTPAVGLLRRLFPAAARLAPALATASIGVFDIENQTGDPQYDYLCRGTTNEIMRRLTRLDGARVIPMHSTRARSAQPTPGRFALNGMLQAYRGQIRLSIVFSDNHDGSVVWAENFDRRQIQDPIELQSDIAAGTAAALQQRLLLGGEAGDPLHGAGSGFLGLLVRRSGAGTVPAPTRSNTALDDYMRGRHLLERGSPDSIMAAIGELKKAVAADPGFALAYAALADAHITMTNYSYIPEAELLASARKYAEAAVAVAPNLAESYEALGLVQRSDWDWSAAERSFLKALALKPSLASARRRYAGLLMQHGRVDEGVEQTRKALEQDPYDPSASNGLGLFLFLAGKYEEALTLLEPAAQGRDALGSAHNLGDDYAALAASSPEPARERYFRLAFEQARRATEMERRLLLGTGKRTPRGDEMYAKYWSWQGDFRAADPYLQRMLADMKTGGTSPTMVAWVYALQERNAQALDLLERAAAIRDRHLLYMKVMPFFAGLHDEPRFQKLVARLGL